MGKMRACGLRNASRQDALASREVKGLQSVNLIDWHYC